MPVNSRKPRYRLRPWAKKTLSVLIIIIAFCSGVIVGRAMPKTEPEYKETVRVKISPKDSLRVVIDKKLQAYEDESVIVKSDSKDEMDESKAEGQTPTAEPEETEKPEETAKPEEEITVEETEPESTPEPEPEEVSEEEYTAPAPVLQSKGVTTLTKSGGVYYYGDRKETYYSSRVLYHYRTPEWYPDEEGFYHTADGYYVVAASDMAQGTIFDCSKGTCIVLDTGCDAGTTDYYVNW